MAEVSGEIVREARRRPTEHLYAVGRHGLAFGGVRVLIVSMKVREGAAYDSYLVMRDGPLAACAKMYNDAVRAFLFKFVYAEAWWRSYGIPELLEGQLMPFAAWLAKRLL